jgi:protease secretion system outer membrane protein
MRLVKWWAAAWNRRAGFVLRCFIFCLPATPGLAADLLNDYARAQSYDPIYRAALADNEADLIQARIAGMAYYPQGRLSSSQLDNESSTRTTFALSQPVINYDAWLSLKEEEPRAASAMAKLQQAQRELVLRLYASISAVAGAREKLELNRATVRALELQERAARRALELGQGTITDVLDAAARLAQNRATTFTLQATLDAAEFQYLAVVGERPAPGTYMITPNPAIAPLSPLKQFMDRAVVRNPQLQMSKLAVTMAEIGVQRARAALYPSVSSVFQHSITSNNSLTSQGLALRMDLPLGAPTYFRGSTADIAARRAREVERDATQKVGLDVEQFYGMAEAVRMELEARKEAVKAARLSVQANEQSFRGGVRTLIDVLNAIQTEFQVKSDYASAILNFGLNLLSLHLASADDMDVALNRVQAILFANCAGTGLAACAGVRP